MTNTEYDNKIKEMLSKSGGVIDDIIDVVNSRFAEIQTFGASGLIDIDGNMREIDTWFLSEDENERNNEIKMKGKMKDCIRKMSAEELMDFAKYVKQSMPKNEKVNDQKELYKEDIEEIEEKIGRKIEASIKAMMDHGSLQVVSEALIEKWGELRAFPIVEMPESEIEKQAKKQIKKYTEAMSTKEIYELAMEVLSILSDYFKA